MRPFPSRQVILVFIAYAVAAGSIPVPEIALADTALFRVEQRWHGFPAPPVTTPGRAGMDQGYLQPGTTRTNMGEYLYPPPTAVVAPGNPIGGAFTLPMGFINVSSTYTLTPKTAWLGYTTIVYVDYYNGPGKFGPNFGSTASSLRLVFPTTGGNPTPNYGLGNPVTPTTTFSGRYDVSRGGSIFVTPGANRFGGTLRLFYGSNAGWYQHVYYFTPFLYNRYGYHRCLDDGMFDCTPNTFASEPGTTALYHANAWVLTEKGRAKVTIPTTPGGKAPTPDGNASYYSTYHRQYLNLIHPWTTGFAEVHNAVGSARQRFEPEPITPQAHGYDISLGGATLSVKKRNYNQNFNKTLSTLTTTTSTPYTQVLKGVTRVVSMVRPRLVHTLTVPCRGCAVPISNTWQAARLWRLKVFFLPEPAGMLMLGAGIAVLLGLSRMRRR